MEGNDLPLQQLFSRLREAGLPLGIDEYKLVLRSLQAGFGIKNRAALKRLCQTLWVKSAQEKQLFDYHFEQVMGGENILLISETPSQRRKIALISIYIVIQGILAVGIILGLTSSSQEQKNPSVTPTVTSPNLPVKPTIIGTQTVTLVPNSTQKLPSNTNKNQPNLILWILLPMITVSGGYAIFRWVINQKSKLSNEKLNQEKPNQEKPNQEKPNQEKPGFSKKPGFWNSDFFNSTGSVIKDEVQIAQAVLQKTSRFINSSEYFPVTERQMKQIWRYLRRPVRQGAQTELDLEATVNQIGRQGILLKPVLVAPRINKAELLLLIDQDGSMIPFRALSNRLAETALRGGLLGKAGIYYFHNCPIEYLYRDFHLLAAELVSHVVTNVCSDRTAVLIFSDAGAARGGYSEERYELTQQFLAQLKKRVRYIAWLNPIPRSRWADTTAGNIASLVPMFEVSRRSLQDAVGVLRGRPTNFEGRRI